MSSGVNLVLLSASAGPVTC